MSEFDKIVGYDDIKMELARYASILKELERYAKLGVSIPSGILLFGEPGVGKTLMANCFIAEAGCDVLILRKEKPNGAFVKQIKQTFKAAKNSEGVTIVFLDDMDKFANEDEFHKDAEEYVAVQSCIDECKGKGVFVLATANDIFCLPRSLMRAGRFDKVLGVNTPKLKEAEKIIQYYISQKKTMENIDVEEIARIMNGHSCADLEAVINEAGIYAGYAGKEKIEQIDIVNACLRILYNSPDGSDVVNTEYLRTVAVHEAGHAVVAEILDPGSVSLVSVRINCHALGGKTLMLPNEGFPFSKKVHEHEVLHCLAGKAATEVVFGIADVGCDLDMSDVYDIVRDLVDCNCTAGFETYEVGNASQYLLEKKDRLVASEVARYYQIAKQIIIENRGFLDAVVAALMEHKMITYRDIQRIKETVAA